MAGKYFEMREYQYLVPKSKKRGDCRSIGRDGFDALRKFVLQNREGDSPLELMRLCSPTGIGEAIQLQNYVGVVELRDGTQIEILPKIDTASDSVADDRKVFTRMLTALGTDVSFKSFERTGLSSGKTPLFELFVKMFLDETARLVRKGIRSSYVSMESAERFVRGKIDFAREARKGPGKDHLLNLVYDELRSDCPENRLVKSTLIYLRRHSRDGENIRRAIQLLSIFEGVSISRDVDGDLSRCVRDRSAAAYSDLLSWCRVFLKGESFTMFKGESVATALLFPMERVFEDYVGKMLRRGSRREGWFRSVKLQTTGKWLFEGRRVSLRPDILCELHNGRQVVLDTKWKRVYGPRDLSVADMHQMYAYGQRYRATNEDMQHVVLVYPWHKEVFGGLLQKGRHVSEDGVQVDMFFFDLSNPGESLDTLVRVIGDMTSE